MYQLTLSEAEAFIRVNLDEHNDNESEMMDLDDIDSNELSNSIARLLPEAINKVHADAPIEILDGKRLSSTEAPSVTVSTIDLTMTFTINSAFLRLISCKVSNSPFVSRVVLEASAEGRMQDNPYTRGTYDNPRLVLKHGKAESGKSSFIFYTAKSSAETLTYFEYLPLYRYDSTKTSYGVAENVVDKVIDRLTGELMAIYGDSARAEYFLQRSSFSKPVVQAE